jgi:hypothetical protein
LRWSWKPWRRSSSVAGRLSGISTARTSTI